MSNIRNDEGETNSVIVKIKRVNIEQIQGVVDRNSSMKREIWVQR